MNKIIACIYVILIISIIAIGTSEKNEIEDGIETTVCESENADHNAVIPSATVPLETVAQEAVKEYNRGLTPEEQYLLAKIAMAEAEGASMDVKIRVVLTVLNRVKTKGFPNTIEGVIFEKSKSGMYQFSPVMPGGRWWTTEPNKQCWEAVSIVNTTEGDISEGALYFESCSGESWHSRNLEFICKFDNMRFYK